MNQFVLRLSFLYALAISFPATGFKIPDKLPNGLYEVSTVKTTGSMPYMVAQYDLELYRDVNVTAKRNDARNTPPNMSHRCPGPTDAGFDAWDIANAKMMLGIWCEMYRPRSKTIVMSVQGNNVWYMCSYKRPPDSDQPRQPQSCSKEEIAMAADKIDGWCGKDKSGSVDIGGWAVTYGRTHKEMSVCRKLKFRSTWLHRVLSGVKGGPGPDEDVKEKEEKDEKEEKKEKKSG